MLCSTFVRRLPATFQVKHNSMDPVALAEISDAAFFPGASLAQFRKRYSERGRVGDDTRRGPARRGPDGVYCTSRGPLPGDDGSLY